MQQIHISLERALACRSLGQMVPKWVRRSVTQNLEKEDICQCIIPPTIFPESSLPC